MKYAVIFEKTRTGYSAHPPDLPGCGAAGRTLAETKANIRWAIDAHVRGLREDGLRIPRARTRAEEIEVEAA